MSSKAIANAIAAGLVPDSVPHSRLYESTDDQTIAAIIFVGSLATLVVTVRIFSRAFIVKHIGLDDILAICGVITLIAFIALSVILIRMGSGRHFEYIQYVMNEYIVEQSEIVDYAAHLIYTTSLLIGRLSGLAFYYRICNLHTILHRSILAALAIIIAGYIPQMLLIILHCLPVTGLWPYAWQSGAEKYKCLEWGLVYSVNSATSLVCDFIIFGIPIAMLIILDMTRKRKIQLTCILLPGVLVVGISITRLFFVIKGQWEADMSWSYNPMMGIEVSEIGGTLIALSVPGIKPVFDAIFSKLCDNSKVSYGSARSRFRPHSQHLSSKENLKESHHRSQRNCGFELESTGSGGSGCSVGVAHGVGIGAGMAPMGHLGTIVTGGKESMSTTGLGKDVMRPGSDAILVKVDFGIDEELGEPLPKDYGLKPFYKGPDMV